jgi:simple sugar transport system permease protein
LIAGEFDLSVGAVFAFVPLVAVVMVESGINVWISGPVSLGIGALIGFMHGVITVKARIPSFITTLGGLMAWRGGALLLSGGTSHVFKADLSFNRLFGTPMGGWIYVQNFWFIVILIVLMIILARTRFGNWIYATGGKKEAARALGINTDRVKIICFMICSFLAGLAGLMQSCRLDTVRPNQGDGLEFAGIAAAVIGGTSLFGGEGTLIGSIVGAILTRIIDNGLVMIRAPAYVFRVYLGAVIIIAVILNTFILQRARRMR